jgi:AraC family transcriptional regulator, regulatory protein of adaptative response / methylated-DNA-[protein]-cysteine methyltransferase
MTILSGMNTTWWKAAERRDPTFDGTFVFAVVTTGIYCRPSCPARRPLRQNVRLFKSPRDAEREGFRACKRCRPVPSLAARACELLRDGGRITLTQLARRLDVSPHHLQRTFTRAIGVSPAAYLDIIRFEQFRGRHGVAPALYEAGFGSSSRLYERARSRLGMTPAAHLNGGSGMTIVYDIFPTPLGKALIAATPAGICAVLFDGSVKALAERYPKASLRRNPELLRRVTGRLRRFFDLDPRLPLDVKATAFQARVWNELRAIPAGKTRTYREIAGRIGRPRSARAVGAACAANPVAVLIPCHRAVGANGRLTGYRWGLARKKALLALESRSV